MLEDGECLMWFSIILSAFVTFLATLWRGVREHAAFSRKMDAVGERDDEYKALLAGFRLERLQQERKDQMAVAYDRWHVRWVGGPRHGEARYLHPNETYFAENNHEGEYVKAVPDLTVVLNQEKSVIYRWKTVAEDRAHPHLVLCLNGPWANSYRSALAFHDEMFLDGMYVPCPTGNPGARVWRPNNNPPCPKEDSVDWKKMAEEFRAERNILQERLNGMVSDHAAARQAVNEFRDKRDELVGRLNTMTKFRDELLVKVQALEGERSRNLSDAVSALQRLEATEKRATSLHFDLEQAKENAEGVQKSLREKIKEMGKERSGLLDKVKELEDLLRQSNSYSNQFRDRNTLLEKESLCHMKKAEQMLVELTDQRAKTAHFSERNALLERDSSDCQKRNSDLAAENVGLKSLLNHVERQLAELAHPILEWPVEDGSVTVTVGDDYQEGWNELRDFVMRAYGVPPHLMGASPLTGVHKTLEEHLSIDRARFEQARNGVNLETDEEWVKRNKFEKYRKYRDAWTAAHSVNPQSLMVTDDDVQRFKKQLEEHNRKGYLMALPSGVKLEEFKKRWEGVEQLSATVSGAVNGPNRGKHDALLLLTEDWDKIVERWPTLEEKDPAKYPQFYGLRVLIYSNMELLRYAKRDKSLGWMGIKTPFDPYEKDAGDSKPAAPAPHDPAEMVLALPRDHGYKDLVILIDDWLRVSKDQRFKYKWDAGTSRFDGMEVFSCRGENDRRSGSEIQEVLKDRRKVSGSAVLYPYPCKPHDPVQEVLDLPKDHGYDDLVLLTKDWAELHAKEPAKWVVDPVMGKNRFLLRGMEPHSQHEMKGVRRAALHLKSVGRKVFVPYPPETEA